MPYNFMQGHKHKPTLSSLTILRVTQQQDFYNFWIEDLILM